MVYISTSQARHRASKVSAVVQELKAPSPDYRRILDYTHPHINSGFGGDAWLGLPKSKPGSRGNPKLLTKRVFLLPIRLESELDLSVEGSSSRRLVGCKHGKSPNAQASAQGKLGDCWEGFLHPLGAVGYSTF